MVLSTQGKKMDAKIVTPPSVTNADFLRQVIGPLAEGEYAWACTFAQPPSHGDWSGFKVTDFAKVYDYAVNAYFSVGVVRERRRRADFIRMPCVVLDDAPRDSGASWTLETSPGNLQIGYIIRPAITDEGIASRLQTELGRQGLVKADQSGYSNVRYVRLPVGANTKVTPPHRHRLLDWTPECVFTLDDLIEKFNLDRDYILTPVADRQAAPGDRQALLADRKFAQDDSAYVQAICRGDMYHDSLLALSARYISRGLSPHVVIELLRGLMLARDVRDDRWAARMEEIPRLVRGAAEKFTPEPKEVVVETQDGPQHPLSVEVGVSTQLIPPPMVVPGFVSEGIVSFAGQHGIGKTTGILPLSLIAAGLIQGELTPRHWRHVVYITEDVGQAQRIISGLAASLKLDHADINARFHLVEAYRMHAAQVVQVAATYSERYVRSVPHDLGAPRVEVLPLVVFDTKSSVFSMENENDAAEAAEMMATLKQRFNRFPVWIIGHIAKASFGKTEALSARGSTAIEADAHQTAYIVAEGESRYIVLGKRRFEPKWTELELVSETSETTGIDEYGEAHTIKLRWSIPQPPVISRQAAAQAAKEAEQGDRDTDRRTRVLEAVEAAWNNKNPIGRSSVSERANIKRIDAVEFINTLLDEGWLYEVEIPYDLRLDKRKGRFLVRLTSEERRVVQETGVLPAHKARLFPSWAKMDERYVPSPSNENAEEGDGEW
jgi:hypothetical protein